MANHLWTRIFSAELIRRNELCFREDMGQGEDAVFVAEYLALCGGSYYIKACLYYWADNGADTLSRRYQAHCFEDIKAVFTARKPLITERYSRDFYRDALGRMLRCADIALDGRNPESEGAKLRYCISIFRDPAFREALERSGGSVF